MKVHPDDPRITAYHLGELSDEEVREVEHAAASDPAIGLALREAGQFTSMLSDTLGPEQAPRLRPSQRQTVLRAGRENLLTPVVELRSAKGSRRAWMSSLGAAAVVAFAAVLMSRLGDLPGGRQEMTARQVSLLPQPGPSAGGGATGPASGGAHARPNAPGLMREGEFLESVAREWSQGALPEPSELPLTGDQSPFSGDEILRLPVSIGTASASWVRRWIEERSELPPRGAVRVEEMVNSVTLDAPVELDGLRLGLHLLDWEGSRWIGVQLVSGDSDIPELKVLSESESSRRIVGSFGTRRNDALEVRFDRQSAVLVLLEFQGESADPGKLTVLVGGKLESFDIAEAGTPAGPGIRHAVAVATFGRWLRGEVDTAAVERALLPAERGEVDPVHRMDQQMIRQSLKLSRGQD